MEEVQGHKQVSANIHRYVDTFTSSILEDKPVLISQNVTRNWLENPAEEMETCEIVPEWRDMIEETAQKMMDDFLNPDPSGKAFTDATSYSPIDRTSYSLGLTGAYVADIMNLDSTCMKESLIAGIEESLSGTGLTHYRSSTDEITELSEALEYAETGFENYSSEISQSDLEDEIDRWSPITDWQEYEQEITG